MDTGVRRLQDIVGHETHVALLRRTLESGRVAGAYLFAGSPNLGKKSVANAFAAALNCEVSPDDACGECDSCRKVFTENHPDVRFIHPDGATFKIAQVRDIQHQIYLRPLEGRYKVYVLTDVEKMRPEAANAILKTLEEPPGAGVLVLVTTNANALLPTIRSRCQILKFLPMPTDDLRAAMVSQGASPTRAAQIALNADGRIGVALELLRSEDSGNAELPETLRGATVLDTFRIAETWQKSPETLDALLGWYRDLLLVRVGASPELVAHRAQLPTLRMLAQRETPVSLRGKMRAIMLARHRLRRNVNATLTMESLAQKLLETPLTRLPESELI